MMTDNLSGNTRYGTRYRPADSAMRRFTHRQALIIDLILKGDYLNASQIYISAKEKEPMLSLSTVYRNLRLFTRLGLVEQRNFRGDRQQYYCGRRPYNHYQLICIGCGRVEELECGLMEQIRDEVNRGCRFEAVDMEINVEGYCLSCKAEIKKLDYGGQYANQITG